MNVFEAVKQNVTTRQAAELYGIRVGRNGMAVCPFHNDKNPSMKVDTRTQRLIQSQDKSSVQPYQTADCMFCGGSPVRLAAFLSAQRQHRHKPCVYGYDCRHAALFPLCHV